MIQYPKHKQLLKIGRAASQKDDAIRQTSWQQQQQQHLFVPQRKKSDTLVM